MPRALSTIVAGAAAAMAAAGCGWLPPDAPPQRPAAVDPDTAALVHAWRVDGHVIGARSSLTEADAAAHRGRRVEVRASGYTTPWHGTCEESGRVGRRRPLAEVTADLAIPRARVTALGFADPLVEYRLSCLDVDRRAPALVLYVSGARALTCHGDVCYALAR